MNIEELKRLQREVIALKAEVQNLNPRSTTYSLSDYLGMFHNKISLVDFGERDRFTVPYYDVSFKLNTMLEVDRRKFNSSFASNKTKLIACMTRFIKGLEKGFISHEKELASLPH